MRNLKNNTFPVLRGQPKTIPEEIAKVVYDQYFKNNKGQSFERIKERGGFGVTEIIYYLYSKILEDSN